MINESQNKKLEEAICRGEIEIESGLNQVLYVTKDGDTHWNMLKMKALIVLINIKQAVFENSLYHLILCTICSWC